MPGTTAICTWFVADDAASATFFPQVGTRSDAPESHKVYWRCMVCFYASSLAVNRQARHVFFTNTRLPTVDGLDIAQLFADWGVEIVTLPITYRLPRNSVERWGNQFFIFDVLDYCATHRLADRIVVLDSDCVWLRPVDEAMEPAIDAHGALTYELDFECYAPAETINGLSRQGMARFLRAHGGAELPSTPYFGGEIYAASHETTEQLSARARALWPEVMEQGATAPREEAHFLSVLYALEGIAPGTANRFIRRMWTTFKHHDLQATDADLTVWHLPAEKRTGFADLFRQIAARADLDPTRQAEAMGLNFANYARLMGWPQRNARKFVRDASLKVAEKAGLR